MSKPKGKTKEIVVAVGEIETLIQKAISVIDTGKQYEIRGYLEQATEKCFSIRDMYDPM